jgi:hypothetical protein
MRKKDYCDRIFLLECLYSHFDEISPKKTWQTKWTGPVIFFYFQFLHWWQKKKGDKKAEIRKKFAKNMENIHQHFRNHKIEKTQWEG